MSWCCWKEGTKCSNRGMLLYLAKAAITAILGTPAGQSSVIRKFSFPSSVLDMVWSYIWGVVVLSSLLIWTFSFSFLRAFLTIRSRTLYRWWWWEQRYSEERRWRWKVRSIWIERAGSRAMEVSILIITRRHSKRVTTERRRGRTLQCGHGTSLQAHSFSMCLIDDEYNKGIVR